MKEWADNFIEVGELREMLSHLEDYDRICVSTGRRDPEHKILRIADTTCIGFWTLIIEK